jgi:hypothetical protein
MGKAKTMQFDFIDAVLLDPNIPTFHHSIIPRPALSPDGAHGASAGMITSSGVQAVAGRFLGHGLTEYSDHIVLSGPVSQSSFNIDFFV